MEITFIGIFLPRELRPSSVHPRLHLNTPALTEMRLFLAVQMRAHCCELQASRLHRCTARFVVPRPCFSYKTITTISITTKRPMKPSPSRQIISCSNRPGLRNDFGTPSFCPMPTDLQGFQDRIVLTNHRIARLVSPRVSAPCVMGASQKCFFMT